MLPDTYVIFICNYDPFKLGKYRYTFAKFLKEDMSYPVDDGEHTIVLNNHGTNPEDVSPELVSFLEYTKDKTEKESEDFFVRKIQESIRNIKADREMEARYMSLELYIHDQREEARAEGQLELVKSFLISKGFMNSEIEKKISQVMKQKSPEQLLFKVSEVQSLEEFEKYLDEINMSNE